MARVKAFLLGLFIASATVVVAQNGTWVLQSGGQSLATSTTGTRAAVTIKQTSTGPIFELQGSDGVAVFTVAEDGTCTGLGCGSASTDDFDASAELAAIMDDETGTAGALVFSVDPVFTGSIAIPQAAAPTVNAAGEIALDTNRWGTTGAFIGFDGAAIVKFIAILDSDTCTDNQTVKFDDDTDTWLCENDNDTGGTTEFDDLADPSGNGSVALTNTTHIWLSTLDAAAAVIEISDTDADAANNTILLKLSHNDGADVNVIYAQFVGDKDGTPTTDFQVSQLAAGVRIQLGSAGVFIDDDGDGALIITGNSTGSDENLIFNFDDTSNEVGVSSSTSVGIIDFGAINLEVPCTAYDATGWNGSEAVPCMDAIRDILETFVTPDAGVATWLVTPSIGNLGTAVTGEGTGVFTALATNTNASDGITTPNGTATLTNKTLDVEGTGNVITTTHEVSFPVAVCQNTTATLGGNTATTVPPVAVCESTAVGVDIATGFATFEGDSDIETEWHQYWGRVPTGFTGTFAAQIHWRAISTTTNNVVWRVNIGCVAAGQALTDVVWAETVFAADANLGTTLQLNDTAVTTLDTTGCAAGEQMYFRVNRNRTTSGDTLDADVQLGAITFIYRRAQ
jgi:hypothetical protein